MQVFSEPELTQQQQHQLNSSNNTSSSGSPLQEQALVLGLDRRNSYELSQGGGDNTYATIQPRNYGTNLSTVLGSGIGGGGGGGGGGVGGLGLSGEMADYATLRDTRAPSVGWGYGGSALNENRNFPQCHVKPRCCIATTLS